MLGHLKVRLASLQEEIVRSLSNSPVSDEPKFIPENIDLEAGCELLEYYQNLWEEIHNANERNIRLGHKADAYILKLKQSLDSQWENISVLSGLVSQVPALNESIRGIMDTLGVLESSFTDVEIALFALEDTIETRKLQEKQLDQRFQIAIYQERRQAEFNDLSAKLQKSYEKQVQDLELNRVLNHTGGKSLQDLPGLTITSLKTSKRTLAQKVEPEVNLEVIDLNEEEDESEVNEDLEKSESSFLPQDIKKNCNDSIVEKDNSFYFTPDSTTEKLESLTLDPNSD